MFNEEVKAALNLFEKQLGEISEMLKEVSADIIDGGFSQYPVFVAHCEQAKIGEMILDRNEFGFPFSINATTVERLIELKLLDHSRLESFTKAIGDPKKNMCILWLYGEHSQFIFTPFHKTASAK